MGMKCGMAHSVSYCFWCKLNLSLQCSQQYFSWKYEWRGWASGGSKRSQRQRRSISKHVSRIILLQPNCDQVYFQQKKTARDTRLVGPVPFIQRSQGKWERGTQKRERGAQRATKRATKWWKLLVCSWLDTSTKEIVPSRTVFSQIKNTSAVAWCWVWPGLFCFFSTAVTGVLPSGPPTDPNKLWLLYNFLATLIDVYCIHFNSVFFLFVFLHSRNLVENGRFINVYLHYCSLALQSLWLICTTFSDALFYFMFVIVIATCSSLKNVSFFQKKLCISDLKVM